MASVPGAGSAQNASVPYQKPDKFQDLDMNEFLDLMITELQNQDPLNPADNTQLLTQLGQIREIASNDRLTDTLDSLLMGDNMATAAGMIGKSINGMTADGDEVSGMVDRATFEDDHILIHVGDFEIPLENVREIIPPQETATDTPDLGRQLAEASRLIGCVVTGKLDNGEAGTGLVDRVSVDDGQVYVHSGEEAMPLENVEQVRWLREDDVPDETTGETTPGADADAA